MNEITTPEVVELRGEAVAAVRALSAVAGRIRAAEPKPGRDALWLAEVLRNMARDLTQREYEVQASGYPTDSGYNLNVSGPLDHTPEGFPSHVRGVGDLIKLARSLGYDAPYEPYRNDKEGYWLITLTKRATA